jgi:hypothetical protein
VGPSSDVYMLGYHVKKTWYLKCFLNYVFPYPIKLYGVPRISIALVGCPQIFQIFLNHEVSFWIIEKLSSSATTTVGAASTCLLLLSAQQQKMSYRHSFAILNCQKRTVLCLVLLHRKWQGQTKLNN